MPRIELRTPLTGLRLQLEEVREATPDDDPRAKRLEAGLSEVDRLSQMVDELLVLSRAGEHEQPGSEVDLAEAAERAISRWTKGGARRGRPAWSGQARDGPSIGLVHGGGSRSGAGCADRERDPLWPARVAGHDRHRRWPHRGPRRGPGIEPGEESAIFERFHRGRAGRQGVEGTGLGLPIARELVEQWGGAVTVTNRKEGGARAAIDWSASATGSDGPDRRVS